MDKTQKEKIREKFKEKFIIPKGHFRQAGWENVEEKHLWGKYSQDGGESLLDFFLNELDLAIKETEERIVKKIRKLPQANNRIGEVNERVFWEKDIITLIRNK